MEESDLHRQLEALEKRIAEARGELAALDDQRRADLGSLLEALSEQIDRYEQSALKWAGLKAPPPGPSCAAQQL
jgi:predicted  nucleic acid-binding Zn-ribbon protein